ncbi:DUF2339 domain-containing protein [Arenimonas oryziterrae]|uniref:DUF2339 domain-containing protein n=1 Tax=Arenimonas oryziterrae DSM 21050 = YC6267 TaxID=1121015 RepID=A0A091AZ38_9GAMM|nr:DUF2339 domain-containing protein [Arenimonas oryziterrae]KFN44557.1 hypothetical protein N789_00690 [Arenimonas oryziterrae DSM 21050 = YC6267]
MNWVLGILGLFIGVILSGTNRWLFGGVVGFLIPYLLWSLVELRRRIDAQDRELQEMHLRLLTPAMPSPAAAPRPATPAPAETPAQTPAAAAAAETPAPVRATGGPPPIPAMPTPRSPSADPLPPGLDEASIAAARARFAERAGSPLSSSATGGAGAMPPPRPQAPPRPRAPAEPGPLEKFAGSIKAWFTEGNVPVKIGVLVLFAGVAAALRYAAAEGYFTFPVAMRFICAGVAGLLALAFGFRERTSRPAFGLSLQGGGIGILLLTVFGAYKMYGLLDPMPAFAMIVVLVGGAAFLSVLQKNMPLAVLGFLGGYLAPVLINSGSNNYIGLFSYYAVLNAAVFAISWKQSWRLLNLMGFAFTFGVGSVWGAKNYRPEMFSTVEPFLILFFVFYVVIGLLYVIRQTEHRRPWVDGTLVFGTPMVAFPLQAVLLKDDRIGLAFSALVVAIVYAGLVFYLRRRRDERLLTEAYGALALGFATLAIPLAFSAGTTATLWALEGAGVAWLGIRQNRTFPWISGLLLQLLAAGSYVISLFANTGDYLSPDNLLLNPSWLGAAILAFSGVLLAFIHDRHRPVRGLSALLFLWGMGWWFLAAITQVDPAEEIVGLWRYFMLYLTATIAIAAALRHLLSWLRLNWFVGVSAIFGLLMGLYAQEEFGAPLNAPAVAMWALYGAVLIAALWGGREQPSRSLALSHILGLWTLALLATLQLEDFSDAQGLAQGWRFVADLAPVGLLTLGLWRAPPWFGWPRAEAFEGYALGWFGLAIPLLLFAFGVGLFLEGSAAPLPYLPLLNPLELGLMALAAMLYGKLLRTKSAFSGMRGAWPFVGFVFVSLAVLRTVHHWHGEPWGPDILDSGFTQTCLTVVWSLLGVGAWILGSRRVDRGLWMGGAVLLGIVLFKLALVDRLYLGNVTGIVSCLVVGLLLVGVGYIAPSPPKIEEGESA